MRRRTPNPRLERAETEPWKSLLLRARLDSGGGNAGLLPLQRVLLSRAALPRRMRVMMAAVMTMVMVVTNMQVIRVIRMMKKRLRK